VRLFRIKLSFVAVVCLEIMLLTWQLLMVLLIIQWTFLLFVYKSQAIKMVFKAGT
jgi:hypothetical protein